MSILKLCLDFVLCKVAKHFIHAYILVLISEFVVVVILSEWWSVATTVGTSLLTCIISLLVSNDVVTSVTYPSSSSQGYSLRLLL